MVARKRPVKKVTKASKPTSLGDIADRLIQIRSARLALEQQVNALKTDQVALEALAIRKMTEAHVSKISGELATVSLNPSNFAMAEDWDLIHKWCMKHKDTSIFERRLAQAHLKELQADGILPPGIKIEGRIKVSITAKARG